MGKRRILVAEDDRFLASLIRQTLEAPGFDVTAANNGRDALFLADEICPDLVILDVGMPVLDGFSVLRTLKADRFHHEIPVLMLTAAKSHSDVQRAIRHGAADYLIKPFRTDHLLQRVERLLASGSGIDVHRGIMEI